MDGAVQVLGCHGAALCLDDTSREIMIAPMDGFTDDSVDVKSFNTDLQPSAEPQ
eukprot:CAMPEP_0179040108 /NCGR_PEP_ID=MMETSP0796-20121207/15479_1 /TAXON_ID=73915 /ORGANISM="Pyrodinium bahamense, Strain pbaha01" /LENGTH=53 /DNA_ID=CAMNT_0020736447 /DNA_START=133 /DNA_END=295 /DNA_ORIENTATION=-